eukprot:COSAG01_NODE_990_length_12289_cov_22.606545_3_plen_226_part_00
MLSRARTAVPLYAALVTHCGWGCSMCVTLRARCVQDWLLPLAKRQTMVVKARYAWPTEGEALQEGDLEFQPNDTIFVLSVDPGDGWCVDRSLCCLLFPYLTCDTMCCRYTGVREGNCIQGIFPSNYVRILRAPIPTPAETEFYEAQLSQDPDRIAIAEQAQQAERKAVEEAMRNSSATSGMPTFKGFLSKKSPKAKVGWQQRWFVLEQGRLSYYKGQVCDHARNA